MHEHIFPECLECLFIPLGLDGILAIFSQDRFHRTFRIEFVMHEFVCQDERDHVLGNGPVELADILFHFDNEACRKEDALRSGDIERVRLGLGDDIKVILFGVRYPFCA